MINIIKYEIPKVKDEKLKSQVNVLVKRELEEHEQLIREHMEEEEDEGLESLELKSKFFYVLNPG